MSKNKKVTIGENFCFSFKSGNIGTKKNARQYYDSHKNAIENWWVQTSRVPIFIDTNFLLNAYSMPKSQRTLFVNFIQSNKDRIYITDQIDEEYQRKRLNFIKNYSTSLQTISKELGSIKKASDITKHCEELLASNPQPIGFSGILLAKRQNSFYCTYFLHNRNVADTKSPYPIKRLEVIRWFNQKSMVFNQSLS